MLQSLKIILHRFLSCASLVLISYVTIFCFLGSIVVLGDTNNEAWSKLKTTAEATIHTEEEKEMKTPIKKCNEIRSNKIDILKCKILEEELEFKKKLHEEDLKIKILEREHKTNLFKIELEIKLKELEKYNKES